MRPPFAVLATTAALATALAGCSAGSTPATQSRSGSAASSSSTSASPTTLTVFAAASLKNPFTTLGHQFEAAHAGTTVTFTFAGSADLVTQLQQGAPADVFASADTKNMDKVTAADLVAGTPVTFASNTLEIAVPPDNPAGIKAFSDLSKPGVKLVVCAPEVPCGAATAKIEAATGTTLKPVSEESAVTDVLTKVQSGEADAGLVYVTDVRGAGGRVQGVTFPESAQAVNVYPIAPLTASRNAGLARQFTELVAGSPGQRVLADAGFGKP